MLGDLLTPILCDLVPVIQNYHSPPPHPPPTEPSVSNLGGKLFAYLVIHSKV